MRNWKHRIRRGFALTMTAVLLAGSTDYAALSVSAEEITDNSASSLTVSENTDNGTAQTPEGTSDETASGEKKETETTPDLPDENEQIPVDTGNDGDLNNDAENSQKTPDEIADEKEEDASEEKEKSKEVSGNTENSEENTENVPLVPPTDMNPDVNVDTDLSGDNESDKPASVPGDDTEQELPDVLPLSDDTETQKPKDEEIVEVTGELIDLGEIVTSDPDGISFFSLDNATVDLKNGSYQNWIDRVDLPDYAVNFYQTLVEASNNNGKNDFLIEDSYFSTDTAEKITFTDGTSIFNAITFTTITGSAPVSDKESLYIQKCMRAAYDAFDRDHPEVFWMSGGISAYIVISTISSNNTIQYKTTFYFMLKAHQLRGETNTFDIRAPKYQNQAAIQAAINTRDNHIATIQNNVSGDTRQVIEGLNSWLTKNNEYNTNLGQASTDYPEAWECISALAGNTGTNGPVCEGYSRAFKVMCDKLGIPCVLVDGDARGGAHMWNYIEVDGNWYAADITWNDPVVSGRSGAVSGYETNEWLLLSADSFVDGQNFIDSHPVTNRASVGGVGFTNGPLLSGTTNKPKTSIAGAVITLTIPSGGYTYNQKAKKPTVTVQLEGKTLKKDQDYKISYQNNINAGTAKVIITAAGDYTGTKEKTFKIAKASNTITLPKTSYSYNASPSKVQTFSIGAKVSGGTVTYHSNSKSVTVNKSGTVTIPKNYTGSVKITVSASGNSNYNAASNKTVTISVKRITNTITASSITKTASAKAQTFSIGAKRSGSGKITYSSNNKSVTVSSSGKVTIAKNFVGKATITIKVAASGIYTDASKKITVTVIPANTSISSVKNSASKKMTVAWKKSTAVTGYQIQYSTDKTFKTGAKTITVSKNSTVSTIVSSLTKGKTYYVRIRTYKTVSGTKYYSGWSAAKTIKINK